MRSQLFGGNINAQEAPEGVILEFARRSNAPSHTVMNGMGLARKVYDIIGNDLKLEPIIACRNDYPDGDYDDPRWRDLKTYAQNWKRPGSGYWSGAYCYFTNEAGKQELSDARKMMKKYIAAMNTFADQGLKAVIGNFKDASIFQPEWIRAGEFDEFLRVASQFTRSGYGFIGHHIYSYGVPWTGSGGVPYSQLLNPSPQPPSVQDFQTNRVWENWLQGRHLMLRARCLELGIEWYEWLGTEGVWDRMPNGETEGWIPQTESKWGLPKLEGPLQQALLWQKLWPDLTPEKSGIEQLDILSRLYEGTGCRGVHLFALNNNDRWTTYNFLDWPEFLGQIYVYADRLKQEEVPPVTQPTIPFPTSTPVRVRITSVGNRTNLNIRSQPRLQGTDIGDLNVGDEVLIYPQNVHEDWMPLDKDGTKGWSFQYAGDLTWEVLQTTPPPDTQPPGEDPGLIGMIFTLDEAKQYHAFLIGMAGVVKRAIDRAEGRTT